MGTMRHDRTSLWGDPRISATEILDALETEEKRSKRSVVATRSPVIVPLGAAGGAFVAAMGLKVFGLDRAAKIVACLVPPLLLLALWEEHVRSRGFDRRVQ
jgi:hypothetical protein